MKNLSLGLILGLFVFITPSFAEGNTESMIQIFQRLETLEQKARELHGENEVLTNQISQLKKTQKQGFLNIDERMDELSKMIKSSSNQDTPAVSTPEEKAEEEPKPIPIKKLGGIKPAPTKKLGGVKPAPSTVEKATTAKDTSAKKVEAKKATTDKVATKASIRAPSAYEKETYQAAFNKMGSSPTAATKAFQEYIKMQPDSPLAANAQYWIGEIMYSHNNYKGAVQEFIKVLQKYKDSNKAPDAAIKLGYSFYALKNWAYARRTFEDVLKYFPNNENAVKLATQRLEKMKAAGH